MPKVAAVPKHYSIMLTPNEMLELVQGWGIYVREFDVSATAEDILAELEDKFEGEIGQPPGDPIEESV